MKRQLRDVRSFVSKKRMGIFAAIAALLAQPLAILPIDSAYAATANVTQLAFTTSAQTITQNATSAVMTIQSRNISNTAEQLSELAQLTLVSSSPTGKFSSNGTSGWTATPSFNFNSGWSNRSFYYSDSSTGTFTLTATATDSSNVPHSWTPATQLVTVTPTPVPNATLSSTLGNTATVNEPVTFTSSILKAPDSTTPNVRVKTTLADPTQESKVAYEYETTPGAYLPMTFSSGVTYYGASAGFPLTTAAGNMRVTFQEPGVYQSTAQIVEAGTGTPIGAPVSHTVTVGYRTVPTAPAQTTQIVRESDFGSPSSTWGFYNDSNNTVAPVPAAGYEYATDPMNAGKETLKFSHPTAKMNLATLSYAGTSLRDIAAIGYDSYNVSGAGTYVQFNVDLNGSGLWQNRLTYVPASASGAWQSNEGVQNGNGAWRWSGGTTWPDGKVVETRTWNDIVASFPSARIAPGVLGGLFVRSEPGSVNYINNVYVATTTTNVKYNFMEDSVGPALTVTTPNADGAIRAPGVYTLAGTVSDSGVGFDRLRIQIRDLTTDTQVLAPVSVTNFTGSNWTFDVPAGMLVDAHQYRITFTAYDDWNNPTVVRRTVTVDNTAPNGNLTQSGNSGSVTVVLSGLTEPIQTPSGWTPSGSDYRITHTTNGNYSVVLRDGAGNPRTLNYSVTTIDDQAPVIGIVSVTRNSDGTYTILGSANEPLSDAQVSINGGANQAATLTGSGTTWSFTTGVLIDGVHTVDVTATDTNNIPNVLLGYTFTAATPFVPVSEPVVDEADFIVDDVDEVVNTPRTVYVTNANTAAGENETGKILGTDTTKNVAKTPAPAIEPSAEGWKLLGMAWYWWVMIIGAFGAASWAGMNWFRGRGQ